MKAAIGLALAVLLALATAGPVAGDTSSYLAYRVRLLRGETHYHLDAGLSALALKRAREISTAFHHRPLVEVPCAWGEVIGVVSLPSTSGVAWVANAWRHSPTHWAVISARWAYYGVGAYEADGRLYLVTLFSQCRLEGGPR